MGTARRCHRCQAYECCVSEKLIVRCRLCGKLACGRFAQIKDPNVTEAQEQECLKARVAVLKRRADKK